MKIKDLGNGNYQTYPITDDMIEVDDIDEWVRTHRPQSFFDKERIAELKDMLKSTDYIVVKIAEADTEEERTQLRQEYADVIRQRKEWRREINELEEELPNQ